jgi:23S rRNA pseudouridine1911/1915/1917 synthase
MIAAPRLLLHAATLGFVHPVTGARIELSSPLPADFAAVVAALESRA